MKINVKSEKGAITLIAITAVLFIMSFLMSMYIYISNKAQISAETTAEIARKYNNIEDAEDIYSSYFAQEKEIIPIITEDQLKEIGSNNQINVNGKIYTFSSDAYYAIQNDIYLEEDWVPLPLYNDDNEEFTGILDGLGHTITNLYIYSDSNNQGLFEVLNGTVKNLNIRDSYVRGSDYVGAIAGRVNTRSYTKL